MSIEEGGPDIDEFHNPSNVLPNEFENVDHAVESHKNLAKLNTEYNFTKLDGDIGSPITPPATQETVVPEEDLTKFFPVNKKTDTNG